MNKIKDMKIENLIYKIRGKQVMLDSDVAMLYGYDTKRVNEILIDSQKTFVFNLILLSINIS